MLMNVSKEQILAAYTPCVTIPRDRISVHVNLDILEMDGLVKVNFSHLLSLTNLPEELTFIAYIGRIRKNRNN